ncbi:hypothetical protein ACFLYQ_03670 [Chloroflexota bacterium]
MVKISSGKCTFSAAGVFSAVIMLALLAILPCLIFTSGIAGAAPDEVKWCIVDIPAGGEAGNWVLAGGSDVKHLAMTSDGTLYCYANPSATSHTLYKSDDAGFKWSSVAEVTDTIVDIAPVPGTGDIYYATESDIYKSVDGGGFIRLPSAPGGAGSGNVNITCIDVFLYGEHNIVVTGTSDNDTLEYGGVYVLDENEIFSDWLDTNIGAYDACVVAFSPNYSIDRQLLAVVTDEQDTIIRSRIDSSNWGQIFGDAVVEDVAAQSAAIAFPDDYNAIAEDYTLFMAIDSGNDEGDVYKVYGVRTPDDSLAVDLNAGFIYNLDDVDITGLAVSGNTTRNSLLAGAAGSTVVYRSTDDGINWKRSVKEPTGQSDACLIMGPDFIDSGIAYAATSGDGSAFSFTVDGGVTWNQAGLIDTGMSGGIIDIALSPVYSPDNALFMLTFCGVNTEHSLWRRMDDGVRWERVFTTTPDEIDSLNLIELSPEYGGDSRVIFLSGTRNGDPVILKSADNGQTYLCLSPSYAVDVWESVNDSILLVGSYNGSGSLIYSTGNSGLSFLAGATVGSQPLASIAISPDYQQEMTILAGNTNGWVYYSTNNGTSFSPLPADAVSAPLDGSIFVAFDSGFATNNTVYAASNSVDEGVYRFKIGSSVEWERVDTSLPAGGTLGQVAVSADGALYAVNSQSVDTTNEEGGMERSLNPAYSSGSTFETVIRGLGDGASLSGLWLRGNQLWSVDTQNTRLMTYIDSLTEQVILTSPLDEEPGTGIRNVMLNWETMRGATGYTWQIDYDTDFSSVPSNFEGSTQASSVRLPDLDLDTTYYWRVRANQPVLSRWSDRRSFNTALGHTIYAPVLLIPEAGETDISLKPLFQWSALAGAENYELLVSRDASFSSPVIIRINEYALPATAWYSDINLEYDSAYYWKVRAGGSGSLSDWSAVSVFSTISPDTEEPLLSEPVISSTSSLLSTSTPEADSSSFSLPLPSQQPLSSPVEWQISSDLVIYVGAALLLVIVILLVTLLVMVAQIKRV